MHPEVLVLVLPVWIGFERALTVNKAVEIVITMKVWEDLQCDSCLRQPGRLENASVSLFIF
jgi:hypothetical protein